MINEAKAGIKSSYSSEEYALIQSVNAINELNRSYNLVFERLSEWFGIYFPDAKVGNPYSLAKLVQAVASKETLTKEDVESITGKNETSEDLYRKMSNRVSREMSEEERSAISRYAEIGIRMEESRLALEAYIKASTERLLPNTAYLTDNMVAAELLNRAGSLDRLVMMPAGTIQLLGAEKALFKHIKFGSKPPKYGVLFRLPAIAQARADIRGRLARAYSAKIATALKADIITKRFIGDELKSSLDKSVERILQSPQRQRHSRSSHNNRGYNNKSYETHPDRQHTRIEVDRRERGYSGRDAHSPQREYEEKHRGIYERGQSDRQLYRDDRDGFDKRRRGIETGSNASYRGGYGRKSESYDHNRERSDRRGDDRYNERGYSQKAAQYNRDNRNPKLGYGKGGRDNRDNRDKRDKDSHYDEKNRRKRLKRGKHR